MNVSEAVFLAHWKVHVEHHADKLRTALEFLDTCRRSPGATETGAMRDAHEWVELASRELLAVIWHFPGWQEPQS